MIFEEKNWTLAMLYQFVCYRTSIPKYHFEMLLFNLAQGAENFDFYPKMGNTIFWSLQAQWRNVFFEFLKATNEEKLKKICFSVDQVNTVLTNFGGLKKVQRILFQIFSWALLFEKKKHFFENKTFNVRSFKFFWTILLRAQPNLPFFKGLNSKKYIWSAAMRPISKSQKVLVHLTQMHIVACW